jgi:thiamine biosynthesis lipoprotein
MVVSQQIVETEHFNGDADASDCSRIALQLCLGINGSDLHGLSVPLRVFGQACGPQPRSLAHRPSSGRWQIGIERPETDRQAALLLELEHGALATIGDSKRFLLKDGVRYGHVLDPRTGWAVLGAPRSVTVAASSYTEAGLVSTLALIHASRSAVLTELAQRNVEF